ncbi:MAG: ABC transporter substrate-binding protein [Xanthobacteraceae bacterium]
MRNALFVSMVTIATGLVGSHAALANDPLRIGIPTSLTGPYVELGAEVKRGAEFAANEVNAKGGVDGRKVELEYADTEGNPDAGRRAAEKLVRSGYRLLTGTISSAVGLAIGGQMEKWDALYISSINKSDRLTGEACNARVFRADHSDSMDMALIGPWLKSRPEREWGVMAADYGWGHDSADAFTAGATVAGKTIKIRLFAPLGTKDYAPYIQQIKDAGVQGLWVAEAGRDAVNFGVQAKQFKLFDTVFAVSQSFAVPSTIKGMGDLADGVWGIINYTSTLNTPGNKAFVAEWVKVYGKEPGNFEAETYVAMKALFAAVAKAHSVEPGAVAKALSDISFDVPFYGHVTMRTADHQLMLPNYIGRVARVDGELKPVVEVMVDAAHAMPPPSPACKM